MALDGNCACGIAEMGRTGSFYPNGMTAQGGRGNQYGLQSSAVSLLSILDEHIQQQRDLPIHTLMAIF